ncbi:MAG TPA: hypothetical protein VD962_10095 [Rubricoccaceae bacterium]|nr:hypothetical protein [Rubricoccaceae bacterium]
MRALLLLVLSISVCGLAPAAAQPTTDAAEDVLILAAGDTLRGDLELREPLLRSKRFVLDGEREFPIGQVREARLDGQWYAVGRTAMDTAVLMRQVEAGRISLYTADLSWGPSWAVTTPGPTVPMTMTPGGSTRLEYFRKGNGPIRPASYGNLREAMSDDPAAMRVLRRRQTLSVVGYAMAAAAAGLVIGGATQLGEDEDGNARVPTLALVGIGVGLGSRVPFMMRGGLLDEAIATYNRTE